MPRYTLTAPAFIDNRLMQPGEVVVTDLPPGPHMVPAVDADGREDPAARAAKDDALAKEAGSADLHVTGDLVGGASLRTNGAIVGEHGVPGLIIRDGVIAGMDGAEAAKAEATVPLAKHEALQAEVDGHADALSAAEARAHDGEQRAAAAEGRATEMEAKVAAAEARASAAETATEELRAKIAALETDLASATAPDQPTESGEDTSDGEQASTGRRRRGG